MLVWKDGWKYFLLAFCDVEGNYFTVLAYRYSECGTLRIRFEHG